jgi:hypothetical protein
MLIKLSPGAAAVYSRGANRRLRARNACGAAGGDAVVSCEKRLCGTATQSAMRSGNALARVDLRDFGLEGKMAHAAST